MLTRLTFLFAALPVVAFAEPVLVPGFDECAMIQQQKGEPLGICVRSAMANCVEWPAGEPDGTACFVTAKDEFGDILGYRLDQLQQNSDEKVAQIAEIEIRYDLERNLRECDRQMELLLIEVPQDERTAYMRAQCEATAVATTVVTLILRAGQTSQ